MVKDIALLWYLLHNYKLRNISSEIFAGSPISLANKRKTNRLIGRVSRMG